MEPSEYLEETALAPGRRRRLALIVDPRFSGGTSAAVAAEILALAADFDLGVFAVETAMFKGRRVHPGLERALGDLGLELVWNPPVIHADVAVFHNPSCLKFNKSFETRISCQRAYVVTHENFLRPGGAEGFDVGACLGLIRRNLLCGRASLAPVSAHNREGVARWLAGRNDDWALAEFDWFNILDLEHLPPTPAPRDRRGRHSRAGFEKFPPMETMRAHFPRHAESCVILGGDSFLLDPETLPKHWKVKIFGEMEVEAFLRELDFFVYFTHPGWRESFGRVIPEAIAAGKLVITDPGTASSFGTAVVASEGKDVDAIIQGFIAEPGRYVDFVRAAQASLDRFRPEAFARHVLKNIERDEARCDTPLL